jgi:hypothetical protein
MSDTRSNNLRLFGICTDASGKISFRGYDTIVPSSKTLDTQVNIVIHQSTGEGDSTGYLLGHTLGAEEWTGDEGNLTQPQAGQLFSAYNNAKDFTGAICEYIVFSTIIPPDDLVKLYNWLNSKWIYTNVTAKDIYDTALVWYKETGIVGATPITQWTNEGYGGSDYDLDTPGGTTSELVKTTINGVDAVRNKGNAIIKTSVTQHLGFSHSFTLFLVVRHSPVPIGVTGGRSHLMEARASTGQTVRVGMWVSQDYIGVYTGSAWLNATNAPFNTATHIVVIHSNRDSTTSIQVDDNAALTGDAGADYYGNWMTFFDDWVPNDLYRFRGDVGELIYFSGDMGAEDEEVVRNYLQNKWNPSPMTASELLEWAELWYNEDGIVGSSPVTEWQNQGLLGSSYDYDTKIGGTPSNLTSTTVNGIAAINFAGDVALETTTGIQLGVNETTEFIVFRRASGLSSANRVLTSAKDTISEVHSFYVHSSNKYYMAQTWSTGSGLSNTIDTNTHLLTGRFNGDSTSSLALDGGTPTTADVGTHRYDVGCIGANWDDDEYWEGDICEYIMFNGKLSEDEKDLIEEYLLDKWGI